MNTQPLYNYPKAPDKLDLFTNYRYVERPKTAAVSYLEHMLTHTSLTTQKLSHRHIQTIGRDVYKRKVDDFIKQKHKEVKHAIEQTQTNCEDMYKLMLKDELDKAEQEKKMALDEQKQEYEVRLQSFKVNRDKIEEDRIQRLILQKNQEKEKALEIQWEKAERLKLETVKRELTAQYKLLRRNAVFEKEKEIAQALNVARSQFKQRMAIQVEKTKKECNKIAEEFHKQQLELHGNKVIKLKERISELTRKCKIYVDKKRTIQQDYVDLENDYSKFIDFTTTPPCHSDFMLSPGKYNLKYVKHNLEQASQTNLIALRQNSVEIQTSN